MFMKKLNSIWQNTNSYCMNPIVLYDGHCALCHRSVRFLIRHDSRKRLLFLAQEDPLVETLLEKNRLTRPQGDSLQVLHHGKILTQSDAVFYALQFIDSPWHILGFGCYIPGFIRNSLYRLIARYRYRWFGYYTHCPIPDANVKSRHYQAPLMDS